MDAEYPSIWRPYFGKSGLTSYFPKKGNQTAQAGSDQVMNTIKGFAGNGTIGYVEYAYPKNAGYPVVKVLNKGGFFVEPTTFNVAVALTKATIDRTTLTQRTRRGLPQPGPAGLPAVVVLLHDHPDRGRRPADDDREAPDAGGLPLPLAVPGAGRRR
ncbi:substrate-binding domain-containing protein [Nocardioides convexus]|uniref:substrate-binding domain-containing protein n=1 Tax=Nocardioides convexus TaxID=2712224 RepID=UPI0024186B34|nr:substrate-binding domain-containing protein [Nocardioides convexus]